MGTNMGKQLLSFNEQHPQIITFLYWRMNNTLLQYGIKYYILKRKEIYTKKKVSNLVNNNN